MVANFASKEASQNKPSKKVTATKAQLAEYKAFMDKALAQVPEGLVGEEFTDKKTGKTMKAKSFHSVTSGFNEAVRILFGEQITPEDLLTLSVQNQWCTTRFVGKNKEGKGGISGVRVYPYSASYSSGRGNSLLSKWGYSK